ncbi:hypothetical protein CHELA20_53285 [Hyphomicrobiales bacterium]|nr:hypothetical protein CHELA20_53285 [Hyphomicrobiales bacterium]
MAWIFASSTTIFGAGSRCRCEKGSCHVAMFMVLIRLNGIAGWIELWQLWRNILLCVLAHGICGVFEVTVADVRLSCSSR